MSDFSSSQEGQQDGVERTIQTPAPFDWATASAEDKVRRRWPDATDFGDIYNTKEYSENMIGFMLGRTWEEAAHHPSVLELQRRETFHADRKCVCSSPMEYYGSNLRRCANCQGFDPFNCRCDRAECANCGPRIANRVVSAESSLPIIPALVAAGGDSGIAEDGDLPDIDMGATSHEVGSAGWYRTALACRERQLHTALAELSALKESAGAGFEEWYSGKYPKPNNVKDRFSDFVDDVWDAHHSTAKSAWTAARASRLDRQVIRREALQEALEAVRGERLEQHDSYLSQADDVREYVKMPGDYSDQGYSLAIRDAESAILTKIEAPGEVKP